MKARHRLVRWHEHEIRLKVAREIAEAIERSVCEPGEHCRDKFCQDCVRYQQARADADVARRVGGVGP